MNEISSQTVGGGSGLFLGDCWKDLGTAQHFSTWPIWGLFALCRQSEWAASGSLTWRFARKSLQPYSLMPPNLKLRVTTRSAFNIFNTNWGHCGGLGFWSKESSRTHQGWDIGGRLSPLSLLVNLLPVVHWPVTACMSGGETTLPWKCCKFILKTPRLWLWKAVENWQNCGCLDSLWTAGVFEAGKGTWAATEHQLWVLCALEALRCGVWEIFTRIFHFAILISVE